ncbi:hypothetical protein IU427_33250 [Nocardia beijingensis]|uniref:hypothetical protein n=1 Tax=Nocardia beijingensis TaxID=95162 RepID=UPI0018931DAA|nr:hypothetical protein [Nocardia beijingensis]MBF6469986.1 hypothetical protein [Nocardia beijingensis]
MTGKCRSHGCCGCGRYYRPVPYRSGAEIATPGSGGTTRNDIDRLRKLGYPGEARIGVDGGYRIRHLVNKSPSHTLSIPAPGPAGDPHTH